MSKSWVLLHILFLIMLLSVYSKVSEAQQNKQMFANPILAGFYPDPSICKVDSNYYLVTSTFSYFPGLPVFQSKDLVNWKLINYILDRPEQLDLEGQGVSRGLFAPTIRYYEGTYFVTCTLVDLGGNFVTTSASPEGPWSNPVWLPEINGIDPSLFFDDNGKSYILYNSDAPNNQPMYQGHRTVRMYEFDQKKLEILGEEIILVNGGSNISEKPVWIEGPHIYKVRGVYYLIAAEGGTSDQHSEVVFKSDNVGGPYVPYEKNPILTQRHLDPERKNPITATGHADFVMTDNGDWWAAFLGVRPYSMGEGEFYNTGRETFLAPVEWIEGWPVINPDYEEVQYFYNYPLPQKKEYAVRSYGGNFSVRDNFDKDELDINWMYLRTPHEKWYNLTDKKGCIELDLREATCSGSSNPSFLGFRQQHMDCTASTSIQFDPKVDSEKAGLLIFLNENRFYFLCKSLEDGVPFVQLYKSIERENAESTIELLAKEKISKANDNKILKLMIEANEGYYSFYYYFNDEETEWSLLRENVDAKYLNSAYPNFVGCMFALYATSLGKESNSKCYFDYFEYEGKDKIYESNKE